MCRAWIKAHRGHLAYALVMIHPWYLTLDRYILLI
jgi:hypothetical protein